jgi:hypothetical protein
MREMKCVLAILGFLALVPVCRAQHELFVPANDVSFTISTERSTYKYGEQIELKYKITNISNAALFVPRWLYGGDCPHKWHVRAWFEDSSGKHYYGGWGGSCSPTPMGIVERMRKDTVLLNPMQEFEGTLDLPTDWLGVKPDKYRIEAYLDGWLETDFTAEQEAELASMGHPFLRGDAVASIAVSIRPR